MPLCMRAFGAFENLAVVVVAFLMYGLYFGLTEGVEKAWVADLAPGRIEEQPSASTTR